MYKTGLVSISFRSICPEELINKVKEAGLEYIERVSIVLLTELISDS